MMAIILENHLYIADDVVKRCKTLSIEQTLAKYLHEKITLQEWFFTWLFDFRLMI